ncbi:hypothetical protein PY650_26245 [Rhizobium calliandrae]|uniref:Uncharacterized protein n=1 Tax=Rhizobium calliandrae TaxID=1312182 RepID=A0ABT7KKE4_9HYPH|nr:hypothetical protein [Rhizobium calliandrae]MDL2409075.1 hypothetical protein [Rhizobium calliandrae]
MTDNNSENNQKIRRNWESFWDGPGSVLSGLTKNQEVYGFFEIADALDHANLITTG